MIGDPVRKEIVDESRAAALLGLSRDKLRELSDASGLGILEPGAISGNRFFTYEDLYRLCRMVAGPAV
jgi:hypothetical protein